MKFASYIRTATECPHSIEAQLDSLRTWTAGQESAMGNIYIDEAVSGISQERPELERLLADAEQGIFDTVVVTTLDRISRNRTDLETICTRLTAHSVSIVAVQEPDAVPFQAVAQ